MPTLFEVRAFPVRYRRTLAPNPLATRGKYIATVHAVDKGRRLMPDLAAVREGLPAQWRKAFDRATRNGQSSFSWDVHNGAKPMWLTLRTKRGDTIATLYAIEYERN